MAGRTDLEKLIVQLSGDVRGFEKSMQRAQAKANSAATGIEGRFRRMNATVSKGLGGIGRNFGGGLLAGGIAGLISAQGLNQLRDVVKSVADIADEAKRAGVSAEQLQILGVVAKDNGVEVDALVDMLKKLNLEVGKAQTGGGKLADLFAANKLTFSTDPIENLKKVADLVKNARTEQEKALIAFIAMGKTAGENLPLLKQGGAAIAQGIKTAREETTLWSNELVAFADEFDDKWEKVWTNYTKAGKGAVVSILKELRDLLVLADQFIAKLGITTKDLQGGGLFPGLNQQQLKELEFILPSLKGSQLTADQQKLLELTERRAKLEREILLMRQAGADPSLFAPFNAQLEFVKKQIEELRAQIGPSFGDIGQGGRVRPAPFAPATVVPSSLDDAANKIDGAAGRLEEVIDKFARDVVVAESGGRADAKNPLSTATGIGQFIESTWLRLFRQEFPDRAASLNKAAILALRTNAQDSFVIIKAYARENAAVLKAAGQSATEANLQLAHFLGAQGAINVLKAAPGTPVSQVLPANVIAANQQILGGGATVDDVIRYAEARTRATEADKAGKAAMSDLLGTQRERIEEQRLENQLFGDTSLAAEQARIEFQLLAEAKRAVGRELFPNEVADIKAHAAEMAKLKVQYDELGKAQELAAQKAEDFAEAQRRAAEQSAAMAREFEGAFAGALQGFVSDLVHGKSVTEALTSALQNLADQLLNIVLNQLFTNLFSGAFGSTGGGIFGSLFHQGARAAGTSGPKRRVAPAAFLAAQRYHSGGFAGFKPGEIPAILKRGEAIGPAAVDAAARRLIAVGGGRGAGAGGGLAPQVNLTTKVVNRFDAGSFLSEALGSPAGEKAILNFVKARPAAFRSAIQA